MSAPRPWRRAIRAVLGATLVAVSAACSDGPDAGDEARAEASVDGERPAFVRRFDGGFRPRRPADWTARDQVRLWPQKKPAMVIYEVSRYPDEIVLPGHRERADALLEASALAAVQRGWYDFERGLADGYGLMYSDDVHYVNEAYVLDDAILDPQRPEFLMYYDTSRGKSLVGFMYYTTAANEDGPQVGGPLTVWHFHMWSHPRCLVEGLLAVGAPDAGGDCERGVATSRSPQMLHVWLVDHPHGPFATRMRIEPELLERLVAERGF